MSRVFARLFTFGLPLIIAIALSSCGGGGSTPSSPAAPTPAPTPAAPTVTGITVTGPGCAAAAAGTGSMPADCLAERVVAGDTLQLAATATFSDSTTQNVTSQAQWTSSNQNVATVSASGLVTVLATGETDVLAAYQGKSSGHTVRTKLKTVYNGTTSQQLPIVIHTFPGTDPYFGVMRQIVYVKYSMRHTFNDGSVEVAEGEVARICRESAQGNPGAGGTGVFKCTWEESLPPPIGNLRMVIDAAYQGDGAIAGTLEDTGLNRTFDRVQTVVTFTVRPM